MSPLTDLANWDLLATNADDYEGAAVEIVGKVFLKPERTADSVMWQMYADPANSEWNTLVVFNDPTLAISDGDFVFVEGIVQGSLEGTNAFGGRISAPLIAATTATLVDALAAAPVANMTVDLNEVQDQHGLILTLKKVEFANGETRVFVVVENASSENASFYDFNAKAQQGSRQFEAESYTDYPSVQSDMLPGVISDGVIVFPEISATEPITFFLEARTEDYGLNFAPYVFAVSP